MKFALNFIEFSLFREMKENNACFRILTMLIVRYRLSFQGFLEKVAWILVADLHFKRENTKPQTCTCFVLAVSSNYWSVNTKKN